MLGLPQSHCRILVKTDPGTRLCNSGWTSQIFGRCSSKEQRKHSGMAQAHCPLPPPTPKGSESLPFVLTSFAHHDSRLEAGDYSILSSCRCSEAPQRRSDTGTTAQRHQSRSPIRPHPPRRSRGANTRMLPLRCYRMRMSFFVLLLHPLQKR